MTLSVTHVVLLLKVNVVLKVNGPPTLLNNEFSTDAVVCTLCTEACEGHMQFFTASKFMSCSIFQMRATAHMEVANA